MNLCTVQSVRSSLKPPLGFMNTHKNDNRGGFLPTQISSFKGGNFDNVGLFFIIICFIPKIHKAAHKINKLFLDYYFLNSKPNAKLLL